MHTTYTKEFREQLVREFADVGEAFDYLLEQGVLDDTMCKVRAVRAKVAEHMQEGYNKLNAMWKATETFHCTYEYVRKCVYYYVYVGDDLTFKYAGKYSKKRNV